MKSASMLLAVTTCCCPVAAFLPLRHSSISRKLSIHCHAATPSSSSTRLNDRKADESDREIDSEMISQRDWNRNIPNDIGLEIIRGSENDISDKIWGDIEGGAPSTWMVMKNILGVNIFTYILAALIVFFLSANAIFGPGWLGQSMGWENVGTFTKVSDSLPLSVDVSRPEYLL